MKMSKPTENAMLYRKTVIVTLLLLCTGWTLTASAQNKLKLFKAIDNR